MKGRKTQVKIFSENISADDSCDSIEKEVNSFIGRVESNNQKILDITQSTATTILPDGKSNQTVRLTIMVTYMSAA